MFGWFVGVGWGFLKIRFLMLRCRSKTARNKIIFLLLASPADCVENYEIINKQSDAFLLIVFYVTDKQKNLVEGSFWKGHKVQY